jgi:hypothetical protein
MRARRPSRASLSFSRHALSRRRSSPTERGARYRPCSRSSRWSWTAWYATTAAAAALLRDPTPIVTRAQTLEAFSTSGGCVAPRGRYACATQHGGSGCALCTAVFGRAGGLRPRSAAVAHGPPCAQPGHALRDLRWTRGEPRLQGAALPGAWPAPPRPPCVRLTAALACSLGVQGHCDLMRFFFHEVRALRTPAPAGLGG